MSYFASRRSLNLATLLSRRGKGCRCRPPPSRASTRAGERPPNIKQENEYILRQKCFHYMWPRLNLCLAKTKMACDLVWVNLRINCTWKSDQFDLWRFSSAFLFLPRDFNMAEMGEKKLSESLPPKFKINFLLCDQITTRRWNQNLLQSLPTMPIEENELVTLVMQ